MLGSKCIESGHRERGDPDAFVNVEAAFIDRFCQQHGQRRIRGYALLTLARHVGLSPRFPDRQPSTDALLDHCERSLERWEPR